MTIPVSYATQQIYQAVPQNIQDQDAASGYPLYYYLYGICQSIDRLDTLMIDNMGAGVCVTPTTLEGLEISESYLLNAITSSETTMTIFGTDTTWNQVPTASNFVVQIENENILVPGGSYNWSAVSVTLSGLTRGYQNTVAVSHAASTGANGTIDLEDYSGAPGWSQILDIRRCPQYALPWLSQFIGSNVTQNNTLTYQQIQNKMATRSGFQRATTASIIAEMVNVVNVTTASPTPMLASQVIVLENTELLAADGGALGAAITTTGATSITITNTDSSWGSLGSNTSFVITVDAEKISIPKGNYNWMASPVTITGVTRGYGGTTAATHLINAPVTLSGGGVVYGYNAYAMTILIPASFYNLFTYASLLTSAVAAGYAGTYTGVIAYITAKLGGYYIDLSGGVFPVSTSQFINFIYRYRPAGIQTFIGGY